jgi:hypothetical protein
MAGVSYSAHISNGKSAITTKNKLAGVAKHNLRKYKSSDYSASQVILLCGSENLMHDVKDVYRREFDVALREYNEKQTREDSEKRCQRGMCSRRKFCQPFFRTDCVRRREGVLNFITMSRLAKKGRGEIMI